MRVMVVSSADADRWRRRWGGEPAGAGGVHLLAVDGRPVAAGTARPASHPRVDGDGWELAGVTAAADAGGDAGPVLLLALLRVVDGHGGTAWSRLPGWLSGPAETFGAVAGDGPEVIFPDPTLRPAASRQDMSRTGG